MMELIEKYKKEAIDYFISDVMQHTGDINKDNIKINNMYKLLDRLDKDKYSDMDGIKFYIKYCNDFINDLGTIQIDRRLINTIVDLYPPKIETNSYMLIRFLRVVYIPETMMNHFESAVGMMQTIFSNAERYWLKNEIDTSNPFLDKFYNHLKNLSINDPAKHDRLRKYLFGNDFACAIVFALYYQYIKDNDLSSLEYHMDNLDDYIEKIGMQGLNLYNITGYNDEKIRYVFDNIEWVIEKETKEIK